jgi:cysteine desulfurase / selenocysteine lyase
MHYLDYAATSAIRPGCGARAVHEFLSEVGASPGRGGYSPSVEAGRIAFRCRRRLAQLLGLPGDPGRVAFTLNATHALNEALFGILCPGDVVVVTAFDHNAVLRPVHLLAASRDVEVRMVPGNPDGSLEMEHLDELLDGARLLVVNEASNVLGTRLPVRELAERAHAAGALVLLDAAQSAGHFVTRPAEEGADLVALTGHKGLLGPQGTGALWLREGVEIEPFLCGGTGGESARREMPPTLPDRLEAGTPNIPGIAGLLAGVEYLLEEGVETLHARECELKARLRDGLSQVPGIRVLSPPGPEGSAIVTILADRVEPGELGRRLEAEWGVLSRTGLHCAPEVHRLLGTEDSGALRFSLGWASSAEDVDRALEGVDAIAGPERFALGPLPLA